VKEIYNEVIKETVYQKDIANGLTIILMPRKHYNKQFGIFATNYGSIDNHFLDPETGEEVTVPDGIAHFLEHKLFEGKIEDTFSRFARFGASTNAFTDYTTTAYLFSSTSKFQENLLNLIDFVQDPYFTDENVNKEKGIIVQEIKMYEDDPHYQVYLNLMKGLFHKHPARLDIAGTIESINKITKDDLYLCYKTFYNPVNMVLFLTGGINPEETISLIEENQSRKEFEPWKGVKRLYPEEPSTVYQSYIKEQMAVSQPLLNLGIKEKELPDEPYTMIKQDLATEILLDLVIGKGSNLYQELYDEGLLDDNFHHYYILEKGYGYLLMGGETREPDLLAERLINGIDEAVKDIQEEDFKRTIKKHTGQFIESFNSFDIIASKYIHYHFKGLNYFDTIEVIRDIDLSYLKERYQTLFNSGQYVRSIITS